MIITTSDSINVNPCHRATNRLSARLCHPQQEYSRPGGGKQGHTSGASLVHEGDSRVLCDGHQGGKQAGQGRDPRHDNERG